MLWFQSTELRDSSEEEDKACNWGEGCKHPDSQVNRHIHEVHSCTCDLCAFAQWSLSYLIGKVQEVFVTQNALNLNHFGSKLSKKLYRISTAHFCLLWTHCQAHIKVLLSHFSASNRRLPQHTHSMSRPRVSMVTEKRKAWICLTQFKELSSSVT